MHLSVYVPFVLSTLLGALAPAIAGHLPPATAARLLLAAALVCAGGSLVALGVLAATALGQIPFLASLAGWSSHIIRRDDPVHPWVGIGSALVLSAVSVLLAREVARRSHALYRAWRTCRDLNGEAGSMVVVDDPAPDAYALPGSRIVVSIGMLRALSPGERRVMLAHEGAHLRHRHHLFRALAYFAAAVNPLLGTLPAAIHHATERWADEVAAESVGDRRLAARALARAALAGARAGTTPGGRRAGTGLGFGGHDVPRRVKALLGGPPRRRPFVTAALMTLVLACLLATREAGHDADRFFDHADGVSMSAGS